MPDSSRRFRRRRGVGERAFLRAPRFSLGSAKEVSRSMINPNDTFGRSVCGPANHATNQESTQGRQHLFSGMIGVQEEFINSNSIIMEKRFEQAGETRSNSFADFSEFEQQRLSTIESLEGGPESGMNRKDLSTFTNGSLPCSFHILISTGWAGSGACRCPSGHSSE